jgi:GTPase KRas protein
VTIDGESCILEILDTAGQEEYASLRDQWIRNGEGFVLVYSITSRLSFTRIQKFHDQIRRLKEFSASSSLYTGCPIYSVTPSASVPIMLLGNKSDRDTEREVSTHEGRALAKKLECGFLESSAKNCVAIEDTVYNVVRQLRRQRRQSIVRQAQRTQRWARMGVRDGTTSQDGRVYQSKKVKCKCTIL